MSKKQPEVHKALLLKALTNTLGIVSPACKEAGVSRERFYHYYKEDEEFKQAVDDIQNIQIDFVENQLFKKIKDGSEKSIHFYLRYRGKHRGYTDSVDLTSAGKELNPEVKIIFIDGNKGDSGTEEDA